jgi:hypothetical protein
MTPRHTELSGHFRSSVLWIETNPLGARRYDGLSGFKTMQNTCFPQTRMMQADITLTVDEKSQRFRLTWTETGGPEVSTRLSLVDASLAVSPLIFMAMLFSAGSCLETSLRSSFLCPLTGFSAIYLSAIFSAFLVSL